MTAFLYLCRGTVGGSFVIMEKPGLIGFYDNPLYHDDVIRSAQAEDAVLNIEDIDRSGNETAATVYNDHRGNEVDEIQDQTAIEMRELSKKNLVSGTPSSEDLSLQSRSHEGEGVML